MLVVPLECIYKGVRVSKGSRVLLKSRSARDVVFKITPTYWLAHPIVDYTVITCLCCRVRSLYKQTLPVDINKIELCKRNLKSCPNEHIDKLSHEDTHAHCLTF